MHYFVNKDSVVRQIWGNSDTILFIFAGAAAEFALNKAVDWLYFTGRLPADPLGRLFSTVTYARMIVFSEVEGANRAIDKMAAIHAAVESNRGAVIPDWAYRDVLFMLIDYSIRAYELLQRKLTLAEKEEVFQVFLKVGLRMGLQGLPPTYPEWLIMRDQHLQQNLVKSKYTADLFQQYKKHLGRFRYTILLQAQLLIIPTRVNQLLDIGKIPYMAPLLPVYKLLHVFKLDKILKSAILPEAYQDQIADLNKTPAYIY